MRTKKSRYLTYNGRTQTISEWAKEYGINSSTLWHRAVGLGWPIEKALTKKVYKAKKYKYKGRYYTVKQLIQFMRIKGETVSESSFRSRIQRGWDIDRVMTTAFGIKTKKTAVAKPKPAKVSCNHDCFNCPFPDCEVD